MRFVNPLPFVADIARATDFYERVVGLTVAERHEDFVRFEGGFALHEGRTLHARIAAAAPTVGPWGRDNLVLYFETADLDAAHARIAPEAVMIHPPRREAWGGRVMRLRDPDGHVVEIGEAALQAVP